MARLTELGKTQVNGQDMMNLSGLATTRATNASGRVTWTFPVGFFTVPPVISADVLATANQPYSVRLVTLDATVLVLDVLASAAVAVALIGLTVLVGLATVGAGITVHLSARKATE